MVVHFRMQASEIKSYPDKDDTLILFSGERIYYKIIRDAFSDHGFSRIFEDKLGQYHWGMYIYSLEESAKEALKKLLDLLQHTIYIDDALSQTFALDYHSLPPYEGHGRTKIGELVYRAKPYKNKVNDRHKANAKKLASYFVSFIRHHPSYQIANFILPVPSYHKDFDLP